MNHAPQAAEVLLAEWHRRAEDGCTSSPEQHIESFLAALRAIGLVVVPDDLVTDRNRLREAIAHVLADEETGEGGWGPDVTMAQVLRSAMVGDDRLMRHVMESASPVSAETAAQNGRVDLGVWPVEA